MANEIEEFKEQYPSLDSYWRSIILFGRNVASYKFALAKSLLEFANEEKTEVTLEELAEPFSRHLCEHIEHSPKQATSRSSRFLDACRYYNQAKISHDELIDTTVELGFNNVIDAFHVVNNEPISVEFYEKVYDGRNKKIVLTDDIFKLKEMPFSENFMEEAESRWNLVETAWELGISRNMIDVQYDVDRNILYVDNPFRRKDVTSARSALNGYQKGKCFYCFNGMTVSEGLDNSCDVDHFFPHILQQYMPEINLDGVWNLVLSCPPCNRGFDGKFAKVPSTKYIKRLHKRNEFLINSHHPLRETIMRQTGNTEGERRRFLMEVDRRAINLLSHRWEVKEVDEASF